MVPVLVSVYHRLYTFRRCIEALQSNAEAVETDLYIVSDAAGRPEDKPRVSEVRKYAEEISGFKSVTLIARPENLGANKSVMSAIKDLLNKFERLIFLEDDILSSRFFLDYMNKGLNAHMDDKDIFAICGYKSNFRLPNAMNSEVFTLPRYSPWGIGLWADKYNDVDMSGAVDRYALLKMNMPSLFNFLERMDPLFLSILKGDSDGKIKAADVRMEYYIMNKNMRCVYPSHTMTNVMQTGEDAMHSGLKWIPDERLANRPIENISKIDGRFDNEIYRRFLHAKYPPLLKRFCGSLVCNGLIDTFRYYGSRLFGFDFGKKDKGFQE